VHSRRPTVRSTSSLEVAKEVAKRSKPTDRPDQMPRRLDTSTPKASSFCLRPSSTGAAA
jgi:hypothetical protein